MCAALLPLVANQPVSAEREDREERGRRNKSITLVPLGVYRTLLFDEGAVEISTYDPLTKRAFVTFAEQPRVEGISLADPNNPTLALTIDLSPWGGLAAHATSVSVHEGVLAIAVPQGAEDTGPGKVLFFDTHGTFLSAVTVGALPDMLTFTPNGDFVLTANEGQPLGDYSYDPEGSVSIIDVRGGAASLTDADVATAGFAAFNDKPLDPRIRIYGPGSTVAQDLEPEYIAVSHDSRTAWVTLQENNALAIIDLKRKKVTSLVALGFKRHSTRGNGLDGGRDDGGNKILQWPLLGMYQPDTIAAFADGGETYLVTANEGDVREYDGLNAAGTEAIEIEDIVLDPDAFPAAATIQSRPLGIGRLKVTSFHGDTDGDGDYDRLHTFGARSFSIWTERGRLVFDSGDDLEQITAGVYPANFNASSTNNTRDDRSDDKGPEPEGVTVAKLFGRNYLFVMLERIGGIVVYDLTHPASPQFEQYINMRSFADAPGTVGAGDLGAEGARVISAESSPTRKPLLIVSNEVSGTLRVFEIRKN
jgi:DNA-binding beta-propeller fold protein YncE